MGVVRGNVDQLECQLFFFKLYCVLLTGKFAVPTQDVLRLTPARTMAVLCPL